MEDDKRRDVAHKLLERGLVSTHDEALALADKFLEMDVQHAESNVAVAGDAIESADNAQAAYEQVLYYERITLEPTGKKVFPNARTEVELEEPAPAAAQAQNAALERLHNTHVDLTQMFNVDNMRNAQTS